MKKFTSVFVFVVGVCLAATSVRAETKFADGRSWQKSTPAERKAYLVAVSEVIAVGRQYDEKKVPETDGTFMRQAYKGLSQTTIPQALAAIDEWYKAHPDQLDKPVLSVLWISVAKPNLKK